jgi:hypothetical protein
MDNIPLALLGWVSGCALVWSALFTVGSVLYHRTEMALGLGAVTLLSGLTIIWVVRQLWSPDSDHQTGTA